MDNLVRTLLLGSFNNVQFFPPKTISIVMGFVFVFWVFLLKYQFFSFKNLNFYAPALPPVG